MKQPLSLLTGRVVTIRVGSPPTDLFVHEEVLKTATESRFFQVAFTNGFKETETGVLELPEEDAKAFDNFVKWVYGVAAGFNSDSNEFFIDVRAEGLIKLYALAEYFMVKKLADAVITDMWDQVLFLDWTWFGAYVTAEAIEYFQSRTKRGCGMDKLLADLVLKCISDHIKRGSFEDVDTSDLPDWLVRAAFNRAATQCAKSQGFDFRPVCSYHQHIDTEYCEAAETRN